jgi:1-acyl-sn-glycerol-3-phosphate acyltransferase
MQDVISDKPHKFVPPHEGRFWNTLIQAWLPSYLKKGHGIHSVECRGVGNLRSSIAAGHGILLAPNHCRPADPMVLGILSREAAQPFFTMASWHLFMDGGLQSWILSRAGAFSVYREGMDREALKAAIGILKSASRPLVIFPEGVISRTNDRLGNLMEGPAFIARSAAKQRSNGRVVVHPVAIRYLFRGNIETALSPVVEEIEARLTWRARRDRPLLERIFKIGEALLSLKELEYLGKPQEGRIAERLERLVNHLLDPLETEWLKGEHGGDIVARVKKLRMAILPDMIEGEISESERARRWSQLADLYLAQQLSFYPPDYIKSRTTPERLMETLERFEEDLTDRTRVHAPVHAVIDVGEALEVGATRDRENAGAGDPLMRKVREQIEAMLERTAKESAPISLVSEATKP